MMHRTHPELLASEIRTQQQEWQRQATQDRLSRQARTVTEPAERPSDRRRLHGLWAWLRVRPT